MNRMNLLLMLALTFAGLLESKGNVCFELNKNEVILKSEYYRIVIDQNCGARVKSLKYIPTGQELIGRWQKAKPAHEWGFEGGFWRDLAYGSWPGYYSYKPYEVNIVNKNGAVIAHFRHKIGIGRLKGVIIDKSLTIDNSPKLDFNVSVINNTAKKHEFNFKMHNELSFGKDRKSLYLVSTKNGVESFILNSKRGKIAGYNFINHKGDWQGIIDLNGNNMLLTRFYATPKVVSSLFWLSGNCRSYEWIYEAFNVAPGKIRNLSFSLEIIPLEKNWNVLVERKLIPAEKLSDMKRRLAGMSVKNAYRPVPADEKVGFFLAVKDKNERWFGDEAVIKNEVGVPLTLNAAQGEITGTTFAIRALHELKIDSITVQKKLFRNPDWIDFRVVKVWWQGGNPNKQTLGPELLLHDDSIIKAAAKGNVLKYKGDLPVDPRRLLSLKVKKDCFRQIWISIRVPQKQKPGVYKTGIVVKSGQNEAVLPLEITVRPFSLVSNRRATGIYVHQKPDSPVAMQERKSVGYLPMSWTRNCKQSKHADYIPDSMFIEILKTLRDTGLRDNVYYAYNRHGFFVDKLKQVFGKEIDHSKIVFIGLLHAIKMNNEFKKRNINAEVYGYISDEPKTEKDFLNVFQRNKYLNNKGVKSAAALSSLEAFRRSRDNVDLALTGIEGGVPYLKQVIQYNKRNNRQTAGYFQCHVEDYLRNRIMYGLYLWRAGFDGIIGYCFMDIKAGRKPGPVAYDDTRSYDNGRRVGEHNLMVAYPTANGKLIPTLQLEGIRDGINDLRYIETLEQLIIANRKAGRKQTVTDKAELFLKKLKNQIPASYTSIYNSWREGDFKQFRENISFWILRLKSP